ncbi:MAG: tRNA lysidine(34) synthetase TilS [Anaerolineae bacterium]|nr:tRNA lysidine(34) synthetase TilS [Anaerolineae bacterium]
MSKGKMDILDQVRRTIERNRLLSSGEAVVVGVSGGPDSLCLLHLLCRLCGEYGLKLHVAHLHHGLRGDEASADAEFVRGLAADWRLPCTVEQADVPALAREHRLAVEEAARRARYTFLARVAAEVGAQTIAVGHNADDQAETVLMHWLRGSGLAGLRGMLPVTSLDDYRLLADGGGRGKTDPKSKIQNPRLIRPLLDVTRADIEVYCGFHGLQPRFDRSNLDTTYFRNWLRHEVLPLLCRHNPNVREVLRRSAWVIADDHALLRSLLEEAWPRVVIEEPDRAIVFDLAAWRGLATSLQRSVLREAIHRLRRSLRNINFVHVENALEVARDGTTGDRTTLPQGLMLTLGYDRFTVAAGPGEVREWPPDWPLLPPSAEELPLAVPGTTLLPGSEWAIEAEIMDVGELPSGWEANADPWRAFLDAQVIGDRPVLRARRAGDRFQPLGMNGHEVKLADFLTNRKVPRVIRDQLPLLACVWGIVWVCGQRVDERASVRETTEQALALRFVPL